MTDPIMTYSGLMRMQIDRLNSIAENTSNVNSVGYLQESNYVDPNQFVSLLQGGRYTGGYKSTHSTQLGALKITNSNTDIALASDHWFVVSLDGKSALTRNGNFSISPEGTLMLGNYFVMGESGKIQNLSKDFQVAADGTITTDKKVVDKIKIITKDPGAEMTSQGNGIYITNGAIAKAEDPKVIQGALNNSNVSLESDMTKMIEITRHIESVQRAMSAYDDMLNVGINQLGK
jgi:flagellar basal-body rod protein FlgF